MVNFHHSHQFSLHSPGLREINRILFASKLIIYFCKSGFFLECRMKYHCEIHEISLYTKSVHIKKCSQISEILINLIYCDNMFEDKCKRYFEQLILYDFLNKHVFEICSFECIFAFVIYDT